MDGTVTTWSTTWVTLKEKKSYIASKDWQVQDGVGRDVHMYLCTYLGT